MWNRVSIPNKTVSSLHMAIQLNDGTLMFKFNFGQRKHDTWDVYTDANSVFTIDIWRILCCGYKYVFLWLIVDIICLSFRLITNTHTIK